MGLDCSRSVGPAVISAEFDLVDSWREILNDGANPAGSTIFFRKIFDERNNRKHLEFRHKVLNSTVINGK